MRKKYLLVFVIGILTLSSFSFYDENPNTLSVNIVVEGEGKSKDVSVTIHDGKADYSVVLFNDKVKKSKVYKNKQFVLKGISFGNYSLAIQDSKGHYYLGKVVVE